MFLNPSPVRTEDERERHTPTCGLAQGMEKKTVGEKESVSVCMRIVLQRLPGLEPWNKSIMIGTILDHDRQLHHQMGTT